MILTGPEIIKEFLFGRIRISPFNIDNIGPNSYDLTLSNKLLFYTNKVLDMKKDNPTCEVIIPDDGYLLPQGTFCLGSTNESTGSTHHTPMIHGRSSIARLGLITHLSAGFGDLGWYGQWTLEMVAHHDIILYPNIRIGQVFFTSTRGMLAAYNGKYQDQVGPTASKIWMDKLRSTKSYSKFPILVESDKVNEIIPLCGRDTNLIAYIPWDKRYCVSDTGNIISLIKEPKLLKTFYRNESYPLVQLVETKIYVHRLVAAAFLGPAINSDGAQLIVRHLDGDPNNNRLSNLQFGTHQDNSDDAKKHGRIHLGSTNHNAILTEDKVLEIRKLRHDHGTKIKTLSEIFGVCSQTISSVLHGEAWSHVNDGFGNLRTSVHKSYNLNDEQKIDIEKRLLSGETRKAIAKVHKVPVRVIHYRAERLCNKLTNKNNSEP